MKKLMSLAAVLLSLMFVFGSTASAQTPSADGEGPGYTGYGRVFVNMDAVRSGNDEVGVPMGVVIAVMHISDASQLDGIFDDAVEAIAEDYYQGGDFELTEVRGLGDEAYEVIGTRVEDGEEQPTTGVFARDGEYIFFSITMNTEDTDLDTDIVEFLVDAEPSTTEVDFQDDGTSTGGVFDMMPTADDIPAMEGMDPFADMTMED